MIRKVRNCCETCENLVCVATTIGQLQHTEYLKPTFLDTFKWAIRPVFPETVTFVFTLNTGMVTGNYYTLVKHVFTGLLGKFKSSFIKVCKLGFACFFTKKIFLLMWHVVVFTVLD